MDNQEQSPSRVVHIRLSNSTILGCHKLTELQQGESDIPMSTMLANVLDSLIEKLTLSGKLPSISDHAANSVLNSIYRTFIYDEGELNMQEEPDMLKDFLGDIDVEDEVIVDNLSTHEVPLDKEFEKRSPDEQQLVEEEIDYPPEAPWNDMAKSKLITFQILMIKAPKDILIENAVDTKNIHLQRAIQLVYSALPLDMWGSAKAQELITEVMPIVIHYLGPIPIEGEEDKEEEDESKS